MDIIYRSVRSFSKMGGDGVKGVDRGGGGDRYLASNKFHFIGKYHNWV